MSTFADSITRPQINRLLLNYFVKEGYENAAINFAREANLPLDVPTSSAPKLPSVSTPESAEFVRQVERFMQNRKSSAPRPEPFKGYSTIDKRKEIKYLILKGDITAAIRAISAHFPAVLDEHNLLLFKLLRLNLVEMIREHRLKSLLAQDPETEKQFLEDVLTFVRENLVSKATHSQELLEELEITVSLLCFDFDPAQENHRDLPEPLRGLLDLSLRNDCYRLVNQAILELEDASDYYFRDASFQEFTAADLRQLPPAPSPDDKDDVNGDNDSNNGSRMLVDPAAPSAVLDDVVHVADPQGDNSEFASPVQGLENQQSTLQSQLEKIVSLWVLTEQILADRDLHKENRYMFDRTLL